MRTNILQVNVLLYGKLKVRALVNSGGASLIISTSMVDSLGIKDKMHATSLHFYGISEN